MHTISHICMLICIQFVCMIKICGCIIYIMRSCNVYGVTIVNNGDQLEDKITHNCTTKVSLVSYSG